MYRMDTGKDIPGGAMDKPKNWTPRPTKIWPTENVPRHTLDDGLEYYRNINVGGVSTEREDTYLRMFDWGTHTEYVHQFFELCIRGEKLFVLPSQQPDKGFHSAGHRTADGTNILTIGELRGHVEIRDVYTYPWVPYGELAPWITLEGIGQFKAIEQQKHFLNVLEQFLSILGTVNPWDLQDGVEAPAIVEYDPELQEKIVAGEVLF